MEFVEFAGIRRVGVFRVWLVLALTATAVGLFGLLAADVFADDEGLSVATASPGSVQAVAAAMGRDGCGLYLVDSASGTICVYQYFPRERQLKLTAVRRYTFDLRCGQSEQKELQSREE